MSHLDPAQTALAAAADRIDDAVAASGESGRAGLELSVPDRHIRLYWKGEPPEAVRDEVARTREAGIAVTMLPARHTRAELDEMAGVLRTVDHDDRVTSIGIPQDGGGLDVGVTDDSAGADLSARHADLPIRVHREPYLPPFSRDDAAPVSAGAGISAFNGAGCGSGFSTWRFEAVGTDLLRRRYTLAAHHCGGEMGVDVFDANGRIGTVESISPTSDSIAVRTFDVSLPRMFDGGVRGTDWFFKPVVALGTNRVGLYTCMSGVAGGVRCGMKITETGKSVWLKDHWVENLVVADQDDPHQIAAVEGDSGSPVFTLDEQSKVVALGSLYGADKPIDPCPVSDRCAWGIRFVDLRSILQAHHLSLSVASDPAAWALNLSLRAHPVHRAFYVVVDESGGSVLRTPGTDQERQSATFWNMRPRVPGSGRFSLQLATRPGFYVVYENGLLRASRKWPGSGFDEAATFVHRPGLAGAGGSLEPLTSPGSFVHEEIRTVDRSPFLPPLVTSELCVSPPGVLVHPPPRGTTPTLAQWHERATFYTAASLWGLG